MERLRILQLCLVGILCCAGGVGGANAGPLPADAMAPGALAKKMAAVQVPFIQNQGQIASEGVRFYAKTFAGTLFVTKENELVYSLPQIPHKKDPAAWSFRESFVDRQPTRPRGENESPVRVSHYKGSDPQAWQRQLATFAEVSLGELYPGIRVSLKAAGNNVEKLFHVSPGADPDAIKIAVEGVQRVSMNAHGQLVLGTGLGDIVFTSPRAYQVVGGKHRTVAAAYALADDHYGFKLGAYDKDHELEIFDLWTDTS